MATPIKSSIGYRKIPYMTRPRVIVFGGRDFSDFDLLCRSLDDLLAALRYPIICSGTAPGADTLGEKWAFRRWHTVKRFEPNIAKHGVPAAFHIRNRETATFAAGRKPAFAVAFWDGSSPGTASMINLCKEYGIQLRIVRY